MTCEYYKDLLSGYIDGELSESQRSQVEEHLALCAECRSEVDEFNQIKAITDQIEFYEPEDKIWNDYWSHIYNRMERCTGWILLSVAVMILITYGGFKLIELLVSDTRVDIVLRAGLLVGLAAFSVLLVSLMRERLHIYKRDRYKNVRR